MSSLKSKNLQMLHKNHLGATICQKWMKVLKLQPKEVYLKKI